MAKSKKDKLDALQAEPETIVAGDAGVFEEEAPKEEAPKAEKKENKKISYKIIAVNKSYNGVAGTVNFKDGIGITDNKVIADYFKERGCQIEEL